MHFLLRTAALRSLNHFRILEHIQIEQNISLLNRQKFFAYSKLYLTVRYLTVFIFL